MIITHNGAILTNDGVVLNNIITSSSFTNTYSLNFDGSDDYIDCGDITALDNVTSATWSIWANSSITSSYHYLMSCYSAGFKQYLFKQSTNKIDIFLSDSSGTLRLMNTSNFTFTAGVWFHIAMVYDETEVSDADKLKVYIDGVLQTNTVSGFALTSLYTSKGNSTEIGKAGGFTTNEFLGNLDEIAIFTTAKTQSDITDIFNLGNPTDLTSLNPIAWYRMGDNSLYKDPQWLIPNNENKDKVSNYSMSFDGTDDLFTYPEIAFLKGGGSYFSISMWVKVDTTTQRGFWCCRSATPDNIDFYINTSGKLILSLKSSVSGDIFATSTSAISNNTWTHIGATFDGTEVTASDRIKLYVNGSIFASSSTGTGANLPNGSLTNLNYIGSTWQGIKMLGSIDETAIFNSALTGANMSSIYNGGSPDRIDGATAWWRMGDDATFSTNWTVPDQIGSNDGTSANMDINNRIGDAPGSENNALSYNMVLSGRTSDVPT